MTQDRAHISSFLAIKGLFIEETFRSFRDWDLGISSKDNLAQIVETNSIGAASTAWLQNIVRVLRSRYDVDGPDRSIVLLAQQGWHIDEWRPILLWHASRNDDLLRLFLEDWLFEQHELGIVLIKADAVREFLAELTRVQLGIHDAWKHTTLDRVANGLLKTATDFHLMRGRTVKEFTSYRLPELSFLYMLHELMDREQSTRKLIDAADWRVFLLRPEDVENELLRLHQFGKLRFERAGSFLELTLPFDAAEDFVRGQAA